MTWQKSLLSLQLGLLCKLGSGTARPENAGKDELLYSNSVPVICKQSTLQMDEQGTSTSTTTTPSLSEPKKSRKLVPISQPIPCLRTPIAQTYNHVHPVLLLSLYYLRFPSLVANPVPTLLSSLIPLAALQLTYAVICLPPSSKHNPRGRDKDGENPGGVGKKVGQGKGNGNGSPRPDQIRKRSSLKKDGPIPLSSRIIVCLHFLPVYFWYHLTDPYILARSDLPHPDPPPSPSITLRPLRSPRRSPYDTPFTYVPSCYPYLPCSCATSILRSWRGCQNVERD